MSDTTNMPRGPEGYLVVLPLTIIEIPLSSNLSWLPLFYALPPGIHVPWLDYQHFSNLVGNLTDLIVEEQNLQPSIDAIWNNRQIEDYTDGDSYVRKDFLKHWTHVRSDDGVKAVLSLEEMCCTYPGISFAHFILYNIFFQTVILPFPIVNMSVRR